MSESSVKVRFAPSPTGELHLGGARTALFNWLFAKHNKGKFFLRIEDTDTLRSKEKYTKQILDSLSWLGFEWDDPIIYQSERNSQYKLYLKKLLDSNQVYRCFCSKNDLEESRNDGDYKYSGKCRNLSEQDVKEKLNQGINFTYRIFIPDGKTDYNDLVYGQITVDNNEIDDFIIVRSDGSPTYNFTAVADDHDMSISHVIRGEDHLSNTPKQIILYKSLGYDIPTFAHLPLILGPDRKRLSKRHGAPGIQYYRDQGYFPIVLINHLALLGWNLGNEEEIFSINNLIENFDLSDIHKKGAVWDKKKLQWISGQHLKNMSTDEIMNSIRSVDEEWGKGHEISFLIAIIEMLKVRAKSLNDFIVQSESFFKDPKKYNKVGLSKCWKDDSTNMIVESLLTRINTIDDWRKEEIDKALKLFADQNQLAMGKITMPIRMAVLGSLSGPSVIEILALIGKKTTIHRLNKALEKLPI